MENATLIKKVLGKKYFKLDYANNKKIGVLDFSKKIQNKYKKKLVQKFVDTIKMLFFW